eukprot:TRINITY_DN1650_c0_g3_i2.p1 TRINITY_DN1650_c0_g3~~TRINITY_DN1650_c0_g3_i2.p1  ORF type:complete len:294 (-),score=75.08 TRINITY_DN1650_c0_g3_i2:156-1037(-)
MDPENDSFSKMDESLKRERIFEKLFDDLENVGVGSSPFEKLPKLILSHILQFLNAKDLAPIFRLNKFFFKFLWISPNSGLLWEKLFTKQEGEKVNERDVEQYVMNPTIDKFEKKMNRYLLYFKHSNLFEWDPKYKEDVFEIYNKRKVVYERRSQNPETNVIWSIASKNVFKCNNKKVELTCSFKTRYHYCATFSLITSSYSEWNDYANHSDENGGTGEGTIPTEINCVSGKNYDIKILIDIDKKTMTTTCLTNDQQIILSLSGLVNAENGLRFAVSLTEVGDYFEVKKMRTFS